MNMKQLKYVLVLAEEGSFSKAADALGISQPSLSQYVKKIEREIGIALFDRTGGNVRLTDAGRVYIDAGRKILDLEHQMEVQFSDLSAHKIGSLIVGTSPYRSAGMMPLVAKRFQEIYPGMHLIIHEATTAELVERMERGVYDLCVTMLPVDLNLFACEKVTEEELLLAVPAGGPVFGVVEMEERKYPAIDAKQLDGHSFVMVTETQFMQRQLERICQEHSLRLQKGAVVKSLEAQIAMVRAGVGMALVPSGIERLCSQDEVVFYSFTQALSKREVVVIWRKDRPLSQAARKLKEVICEIDW